MTADLVSHADVILVVGGADPVGVRRLLQLLDEMGASMNPAGRSRSSSTGCGPRPQDLLPSRLCERPWRVLAGWRTLCSCPMTRQRPMPACSRGAPSWSRRPPAHWARPSAYWSTVSIRGWLRPAGLAPRVVPCCGAPRGAVGVGSAGTPRLGPQPPEAGVAHVRAVRRPGTAEAGTGDSRLVNECRLPRRLVDPLRFRRSSLRACRRRSSP